MSSLSSLPPQQQDPSVHSAPPVDQGLIESSLEQSLEISGAYASGNDAYASHLLDQQARSAMVSDIALELAGMDPLTEPPIAEAMVQHPDTVVAQEITRSAIREEKKLDLLEANGWSDIKAQAQGVIEQFKASRQQPVSMDPAEAQGQGAPIAMDPNMLGDINGRLAKLHNEMRAAGFPEGIYGDPDLKRTAMVFSQTQGLVQEGEQPYNPAYKDAPLPFAAIGYLGTEIVAPAVGAVAETGFNFGYGMAKLGADAYSSLTGEDVSHTLPTQVIQDDNGNVIHNGGKLPSGTEMIAASLALAMNQDVETSMREAGLADHYADLRKSGAEKVVNNLSHAVGSFAAFTAPGGWAMAGGKALVGNGLKTLATAAIGPRAEWARKLVSTIADVSGAAAGNAAFMATTYGHHEGYAHMAAEGAISTLPILALGKMGRGLERGMLARTRMPKRVAAAVSGAAEGLGFGLWQIAQGDEEFHGVEDLWAFMQDPSEANWGRYSATMFENVAAMMIFKGAMGVSPGQYALDRMAGQPEAVTAARSKEGAFQERVSKEARAEVVKVSQADQFFQEVQRVGQQVRKQGELEAGLEARGVEVGQEGSLGPQQSGALLDRLQGVMQRRSGKRETEIGAAATPEGVVRVTKGGVGVVNTDVATKKAGGTPDNVIDIHTHPTPTAFSSRDLLATVMRKKVGGLPDLLVTAERVFSAQRVKKPSSEMFDPDQIERRWGDPDLGGGQMASKRVARELGVDAGQAWNAYVNQQLGKPVEPRLREAARAINREHVEFVKKSAEKLGIEVTELSPAEARDRWINFTETGEWAPREPSATGVSRETLAEMGNATGAQPGLRTQARMEATGRYPEPPTKAREQLYEKVSARREFPAVGRPPGGPPTAHPIHARDVIAEAQVGPIAPAVRRGGMGQMKRWAMGYYETRQDLVRMKGSRDLNNLAHEWGHAFYEKLGAKMGLSAQAENSLLEVGKPTSTPRMRRDHKLHEGMAEFTARHLLGDPDLATKHPQLYREVMDFVSRPEQVEVLEQLGRLEGSYRQFREQNALQQVRMSWIAADEPLTRQQAQLELDRPLRKLSPATRARVALRRAVNLVDHALLDDLALARRAQERAFKKAGIDPDTVPITSNPVKMLEAMRGKSSAVLETFLIRRAISFGGTETRGKSLREELSEVKKEELDDFVTYLVARRSLEAQGKGLETQLPREHYLLAVEQLGNARFEQAAQGLKRWFDSVIDYSADAGALTGKTAEIIKDSWSVYIPFFRALEGPRSVRPGRGVAERGSGVQRMHTGEQVEIRDPIEAALEVAQSIIQKSHQAAAMKAFNTLHLTTKGVGRLATEVPRDIEAKKISADQLADALDRLEFPGDAQHIAESFSDVLRGLDPDEARGLITLFSQKVMPKGSKPIVAFVPSYTEAELAQHRSCYGDRVADQMAAENGQLKWLELDKDVYEAVMNIDPATQLNHPLMRALSLPTRMVKMGATAINPAFMLRNVARDTLLNPLFTDVKTRRRFIPVLGAGMNFMEAVVVQARGGGKTFEDIGGSQATFFGAEFNPMRAMPGRRAVHPTGPQEAYRKVMRGLAAPEATLRIREFNGVREKALERGASDLEANLEALHAGQEISVNFIRAGAIGRSVNQFIPYFNAGVQGNRKFIRAVGGYEGRAKQMQAIAQGIANITVPSLVLWMLHKDEDWFQDLPAWRRNNYWSFKAPFSDQVISVPKPFEAGKIFGNIPEHMLHSISGEPLPLSETGWDITANFLNGFSFMPAVIGPLAENVMNFSLFRQRRLIPHWMEEGRMPEDQYTSYTTGWAKWMGKAFNISPIKVENFASGYTGGMGLKVMRALDQFTSSPAEVTDRSISMEDMPFIGSFFSQQAHEQGAAVQQLYDLHRELGQRAGSDKLSPEQEAMRDSVRQAKNMLSEINKAAREGQIDAHQADRMSYEVARPVVERYREVVK